MKELVSIKAEALKWCENGFTFYMHEEQFKYRDMSKNQGCNGFTQYGGSVCVPLDTEIKVNPEKYTAAVIDRIKENHENKELFLLVENITKLSRGTVIVDVRYKDKSSTFVYTFPTNIDPWPFQENGEWRAKE